MGPHSTWFSFIPGYEHLRENLQATLRRGWTCQLFQATHFEIDHILGGLLVFLVLSLLAIRYAISIRTSGDKGAVPPPRFGARTLLETFCDLVYSLMEGPMGAKHARRFLPL